MSIYTREEMIETIKEETGMVLDEDEVNFLDRYKYVAFSGYENTPLKVLQYSNSKDDFEYKLLSLDDSDFTRFVLFFELDNGLHKCQCFVRKLDS